MGAGGIPVVLMMSQRTCLAFLPGAAEAKVVRSITAAPNAKTMPSPQNRLLRCMLPPLPLVHSSVDADLAVQDLLRWQTEDERREQRQLKRSNPGPARRHFDMKCGRGFPLVARLEHAGTAEARAARCHGGARHFTPDGHQREARKLRRPGHETVEASLDRAVGEARDAEAELRERVCTVDGAPSAAARDRRVGGRGGRNERAGCHYAGERGEESFHALPLSPRIAKLLPISEECNPCHERYVPSQYSRAFCHASWAATRPVARASRSPCSKWMPP